MADQLTRLSLYLHIPFCTTKCTYCAFNTYVKMEHLIDSFVDSLCREIIITGIGNPYPQVGSIFFGGGTPSLLTPRQFEILLSQVNASFAVADDAEVTIESNPNDLSLPYLQELRGLGINRLSLGMQSSNEDELRLYARRHNHPALLSAMDSARRAGFDNINLDLIYGSPIQTLAMWQESLTSALALQPEHISMYALGLEPDTPLNDWVNSGRLPTPDDDVVADMYDMATDMMADAGYAQYEISNWSKPGFMCRHNLQYWRNWPYVGLGPGAHGYAAGVRYATLLSPQQYINAMRDSDTVYDFPHTPAVVDAVNVDRDNEIAETLMMGLRLTHEGINRAAFIARFGVDLMDIHGPVIERFKGHDLLYVDSDVVRITQRGRLLSNVIFRELV